MYAFSLLPFSSFVVFLLVYKNAMQDSLLSYICYIFSSLTLIHHGHPPSITFTSPFLPSFLSPLYHHHHHHHHHHPSLPLSTQSSFLNKGKAITSLIEGASAKSMTRRSRPIPSPPVGGNPRSKADKNSSSTSAASSVPVYVCVHAYVCIY